LGTDLSMKLNNRGGANHINTTSYSEFDRLNSLKKIDPDALNAVNFTGFIEQFESDKLDQLYQKNLRFGQLNPAPSYLVRGKKVKVKEWRKISKVSQKHMIEQHCTQPPRASLIYCNKYTYTCVLIV